MAGTLNVIKTLILPAVISLAIFLLLTFVLLPIYRRYRNRYSQYLPLDALSTHTTSLRHRITNYIFNLAVRSSWRFRRNRQNNTHHSSSFSASSSSSSSPHQRSGGGGGGDISDSDDPDIEGEELNAVDVETLRAWDRHARAMRPEYTRRLSRELEEGFRDDSDEESEP